MSALPKAGEMTSELRPSLSRIIDPDNPRRAVFVMLNPSTAEAAPDGKPDPTIRSVIRIANHNGFGRVDVVNLWSYRATEPADLWAMVADLNGDWQALREQTRTWESWREACSVADPIVLAWGTEPYTGRGRLCGAERRRLFLDTMRDCGLLERFRYLALTKDGYPGHPLFMRTATETKFLRPEDFATIFPESRR